MIRNLRFVTGCALVGSILGDVIGHDFWSAVIGAFIFGVAGMLSVIINLE